MPLRIGTVSTTELVFKLFFPSGACDPSGPRLALCYNLNPKPCSPNTELVVRPTVATLSPSDPDPPPSRTDTVEGPNELPADRNEEAPGPLDSREVGESYREVCSEEEISFNADAVHDFVAEEAGIDSEGDDEVDPPGDAVVHTRRAIARASFVLPSIR
jgi:hypothetical protein